MRLLLDTHTWIWAFEGAAILGPKSRHRIGNAASERCVSPVSTLEIARLVSHGDMVLSCPLIEWIEKSQSDLELLTLELNHAIAIEAYQLPGAFHRDPADRQLVATARIERCTILTADERILAYSGVDSLDARK